MTKAFNKQFYNKKIDNFEKELSIDLETRLNNPIYTTWQNIRRRCYDPKFHSKFPSYKGCSISKEWHNFQVFAKWYRENYVEGWQLDKDILFKGNKIYSPETCCFVPSEINTQIQNWTIRSEFGLGVSKDNNKFYIKILENGKRKYFRFNSKEEAANKYKYYKENLIQKLVSLHKNSLNIKVYEKLINYKIEDYE